MAKREKHIFKDASQVTHVWAQQTQESGRMPERRHRDGYGTVIGASFKGPILYSYDTPVAHFVTNAKGKLACLITTVNYSLTTNKNMPRKDDIPVNVTKHVFKVKYIGTTGGQAPTTYGANYHALNIEDASTKYKDSIAKSKRAPKYGIWNLNDADATRANVMAYAKFFSVKVNWRKDFPALSEVERAAIHTRRAEYDRKEEAKREREKQEAIAARALKLSQALEYIAKNPEPGEDILKRAHFRNWLKDVSHDPGNIDHDTAELIRKYWARVAEYYIQAWREGKSDTSQPTSYYDGYRPTLLRIKGDEIETSRGATFPVKHGVKAWALIASCKEIGRNWKRNGHQVHLGHFQIDEIQPDGTVKAGCHTVPYSEIEGIAKQLNLIAA